MRSRRCAVGSCPAVCDLSRGLRSGVNDRSSVTISNSSTPAALSGGVLRSADGSTPENESRFREMADAAPIMIWISRDDGEATWFNARWLEFVGRSMGDEVGHGWASNVHPDDRARCLTTFLDALRARQQFEMDYRLRRHDGEYRWVVDRGSPRYDAAGGFLGYVGTCVDVHERRQALDALRESEFRFRAMADSMPQLVWMAHDDGVVVHYNTQIERYAGAERGPDGAWEWQPIVHDDDAERTVREWTTAVRTGGPYECEHRLRMADGGFRWHLSRARRVRWNDGAMWFGTATDIDELKQTEAALRDSEQRFRTLADNMSQFAWMADPDGHIFWYNRRWYDFTGTTIDEMRGWGWRESHHPDHVDRVVRSWSESLRSGRPWQDVFPLRGAKGEYRWFLSRALPIRDDTGRIARWFGTNTDITEQREIEQRLAQHQAELEERVEERTRELAETYDRLRMTERMAMMGTLSAGLGHDMGNLLVPIRIRLESLSREELSEDAREDVEAIRTAAEYLRRLASGLRLLAIDPSDTRSSNSTALGGWWRDAEGVFRSVLPKGVTLESTLGDSILRVAMSSPALTQVVFNLVQNAGEAMRPKGEGRVTVRASVEGAEVAIAVEDDGPGMSEEVRRRCMEPFFSTKSREISTGLGLSLVYGLAREAGGRVEVRSVEGEGTTFTLFLRQADLLSPRKETTALVELADSRIASLVRSELKRLGVEVAMDERERRHADVVVTDSAAWLDHASPAARCVLLGAAEERDRLEQVAPQSGFASLRDAVLRAVSAARSAT